MYVEGPPPLYILYVRPEQTQDWHQSGLIKQFNALHTYTSTQFRWFNWHMLIIIAELYVGGTCYPSGYPCDYTSAPWGTPNSECIQDNTDPSKYICTCKSGYYNALLDPHPSKKPSCVKRKSHYKCTIEYSWEHMYVGKYLKYSDFYCNGTHLVFDCCLASHMFFRIWLDIISTVASS